MFVAGGPKRGTECQYSVHGGFAGPFNSIFSYLVDMNGARKSRDQGTVFSRRPQALMHRPVTKRCGPCVGAGSEVLKTEAGHLEVTMGMRAGTLGDSTFGIAAPPASPQQQQQQQQVAVTPTGGQHLVRAATGAIRCACLHSASPANSRQTGTALRIHAEHGWSGLTHLREFSWMLCETFRPIGVRDVQM